MLTPGNYEIPFSAILPGNIPESIEGLPGCSSIYRLEATIDRGKFHSSIVAKKRVRVIRTLTTDAVELSETMAVDNTWPQKVEYSLSCPMKAIAIGSGTPVSVMIVPLLKGLQLGDIKIQLVEMYSYVGYFPPVHSGERIVCQKKVPKPNPDALDLDKWEVETFLKVPASLSKCTQDVDLLTHVKVKHKLKFNIALINPDGHTSELRASLPVQLFISPFVSIRSIPDEETSSEDESQEVLFANSESQLSLASLHSNSSSHTSLTGLVAPPLYEQHIYDRLWSDVSPIETPVTSGATTPRAIRPAASSGSSSGGSDLHQFSMSPLDSNLLTENLRLLSLQRQSQEDNTFNGPSSPPNNASSSPLRIPAPTHTRDRATFNLDGDDYFARRPPARSPLHQSYINDHPSPIMSPPVHLSRVPSEANMSTNVSAEDLLQIPSYTQAIKGDITDDLAPAYEPPLPGSNIDLASANKRFEDLHKRTPISMTPTSSSLRASGRSSAGTSPSPSQSRGSSLVNLAGYFSHARSNGGSSTNLASLNEHTRSDNVGSKMSNSGMADRATLVNFHNMSFRKKDKK
ncbi:uncharacterized protein SPAPADRAFT_60600 [Spathaspora passalidarum NRRL Y-27907]|uniref:Arrestin C-terminal-like domain-containing protein n=1 Tax=Spathaspora passalidarum (strain NRRL Y-27907 / 11-Y1) TaxID=619300 RepID=G3ALL7_SPAPN|nr:uncharacterized protein SPAPADRAFT_60600 [Spathaspora passalidarum NRRL Y-27907]EGW33260.1 hypothetical protein SPAPADRAFT_60600 [Spathaspora passalidarum NRRL Y-27907]